MHSQIAFVITFSEKCKKLIFLRISSEHVILRKNYHRTLRTLGRSPFSFFTFFNVISSSGTNS